MRERYAAGRAGVPTTVLSVIRRGLRLHGDAVVNARESVQRDRLARRDREHGNRDQGDREQADAVGTPIFPASGPPEPAP